MPGVKDDLSARVDALRDELAASDSEDRYHELSVALERAHREKVFAPRTNFVRDEWRPVPAVTMSNPAAGWDNERLGNEVKLRLRLFAAGVDTTIAPRSGDVSFVTLTQLDFDGEQFALRIHCPYAAPLEALSRMWRSDVAREEKEALAARAADLAVTHKMILNPGDLLPLVVMSEPAADKAILSNEFQFSHPQQFLDIGRARTTSGLLNFIGTLLIHSDRGHVLPDLTPAMNQGLDEWFRWLYCRMDTGAAFDPARLLVHKQEPERFVYDYDGDDDEIGGPS